MRQALSILPDLRGAHDRLRWILWRMTDDRQSDRHSRRLGCGGCSHRLGNHIFLPTALKKCWVGMADPVSPAACARLPNICTFRRRWPFWSSPGSCSVKSLIVGLFSRIAALVVALTMAGAIATVHLRFGLFLSWFGTQEGHGIEYHLLTIVLALIVVVQGAGAFSLDRLLHEHVSALEQSQGAKQR
jgi:hypothetical protein